MDRAKVINTNTRPREILRDFARIDEEVFESVEEIGRIHDLPETLKTIEADKDGVIML